MEWSWNFPGIFHAHGEKLRSPFEFFGVVRQFAADQISCNRIAQLSELVYIFLLKGSKKS
jgi:hypothetical protein